MDYTVRPRMIVDLAVVRPLGWLWWLIVLMPLAGVIARFLWPGRVKMRWRHTLLLGVAGSFVGGALGYWLLDKDVSEGWFQRSGFLGSIVGALVVLAVSRIVGSRRADRPGGS